MFLQSAADDDVVALAPFDEPVVLSMGWLPQSTVADE
jgi:hypothetical protein